MSFDFLSGNLGSFLDVIDYVANGSFAALKDNVEYRAGDGFAVLVRLADHNSNWRGSKVFVDESAYRFLSKSSLVTGDVLIANVGAPGTVFRVPHLDQPATLGPNAVLVRPKKEMVESISKDFLYYYFSSPLGQAKLQSLITGSAQPKFNKTALRGVEVKFPSPLVQKSIAQVVLALDDRITLLRETNATLEAIAQTLFKSWFVDFDPVRAKTEGRQPEGMDEATAALFPDSFEESEVGMVPRGWRVGQVADLGNVVCGKTPPTSAPENYGADIPFITIPDMHDLLAVTATARSLSKLGADSQPKKYLPPGAICVSCIATPGLVVRVTATAQTNQQINSVIPQKKWGSSFPLFLLRRIGAAVRSGGSGGSVFHNLSKSGFEQLPVLLAAPDLADRFNAAVDPLVEKIVKNQLHVQTLSTLRDTLLPRLISGQLRLSEEQNEII